MNDNTTNVPENENVVEENVDVTTENEEEKHQKEEVGEHDIIIDDDFQFDMEIEDLGIKSLQNNFSSLQNGNNNDGNNEQQDSSLGTEQSGNITF